MTRPIPDELKLGPVTIAQAHAVGVTRNQLRGLRFRRLARGLYAWGDLPENPAQAFAAELDRLPLGCALSGRSAAVVHGLDLWKQEATEVTAPRAAGVRVRANVRVHRDELQLSDVVRRRGVLVTSALRTCFDLVRRLPLVEAVVVADAMLHRHLVRMPDLLAYICAHPGSRGIRQARTVAGLADARSESPMESRLRMIIVRAGLPRPEVQEPLRDTDQRVLARPDLAYPSSRLGIEYDGATHRASLIEDNRRQNMLLRRFGIVLLRYTASDVYQRPATIVEDIRSILNQSSMAGYR